MKYAKRIWLVITLTVMVWLIMPILIVRDAANGDLDADPWIPGLGD